MCEIENKNNEALQPEVQGENSVADEAGASRTNVDTEDTKNTDISLSAVDDRESWLQKYGLITSFFFTVFACSIVYLWAVKVKVNGLEESQKKIVKIYERHIVKTDVKSQQSLIVFQRPQDNHEKFEEEIKSLLELQQSYIQDNFGSFEIWAGILTIVFLVFSFFSLQKSEQMEQQSRDALKKIKNNMKASDTKLSEFENEKNTRFTDLDNENKTKLTDFESKSTQKLNDFATKSESAIETFAISSKAKIDGLDKQMEAVKNTILEEGRKMVELERNKALDDLSKQTNALRTYYTQDFVKVLEAHQEMLKKDYDLFRMQLEEVATITKEATNKDVDEIFEDSEDGPINNEEES